MKGGRLVNWRKGFNRVWIVVSAMGGIWLFFPITGATIYDDTLESVFVAYFVGILGACVAFFIILFVGAAFHILVLWIIAGFKGEPFDLSGCHPFDIK